jgi:hypothetical protein
MVDTFQKETRDLESRIWSKKEAAHETARAIYKDEKAKLKLMAAVQLLRTQIANKKKEKDTIDKSFEYDTFKLNELEQKNCISRDVMDETYQPTQ